MPKKAPGKCRICGATTSLKNTKGYEKWYENRTLCHNCWARTIQAPVRNPSRVKVRDGYAPAEFWEGEDPRKGVCSMCGKKKSTRRFDMHHAKGYDENNPTFGRIELCKSCHRKADWEQAKQGITIRHNKNGEIIGQPKNRICKVCSKNESYRDIWYGNKDNWTCRKCKRKEVGW